MTDALTALLTRRSTSVRDMAVPAPSAEQLETILRIATRVPDHGKLAPWHIIVVRGEGAQRLGAIAAERFAKQNPDATEAQLAAEHARFTRAPLCLAVISTPRLGTKPVWEQELSAGAVCLNILHAAHALGFGAKWLTEWVAYDEAVLAALLKAADHNLHLQGGGRPIGAGGGMTDALSGNAASHNVAASNDPHPNPPPFSGREHARIAGFIYLGTKTTDTPDRERPRLEDVVTDFSVCHNSVILM